MYLFSCVLSCLIQSLHVFSAMSAASSLRAEIRAEPLSTGMYISPGQGDDDDDDDDERVDDDDEG